MNIEIRKEGDVAFVKPLDARIDANSSTELKSFVIDLINQGNTRFVFNLSSVTFMDSRGLGTIIFLLKSIATAKGALVLCNINSAVENLFKVTCMDRVFHVKANEDEAKQALAGEKVNV